ncbi:MAG: biotin/lipoyl-binding protein [Gammaproteobacteria bacterium]|nr:biotin/lipoyl-binding protein [Gammaproteobacteria bacterium]
MAVENYFSNDIHRFGRGAFRPSPWVTFNYRLDGEGRRVMMIYNTECCKGLEVTGGLIPMLRSLFSGEAAIDIWNRRVDFLDDGLPTEIEFYQAIVSLFDGGYLQSRRADTTASPIEQRIQLESERKPLSQKLWSLFFFRLGSVALANWFNKVRPSAKYLSTTSVWAVFVLLGGAFGVAFYLNFAALRPYLPNLSSYTQIGLLFLTYLMSKLLHESAHALAARYVGVHVKKIGVMILILAPIPFVDASEAVMNPSKGSRLMIILAGMMSDILLGFLCILGFLWVEDSFYQTVFANAVYIVVVSSLFFNGNPLLKFDAYYALSEVVDYPDLYQRSRKFLTSTMARWVGAAQALDKTYFSGRPALLGVYGVASSIYAFAVTLIIAKYVFSLNELVGYFYLLLAFLLIFLMPLKKAVVHLVMSPYKEETRIMRGIMLLALAGLLVALAVVPLPWRSEVHGLVDIRSERLVSSQTLAEVVSLEVQDGDFVRAGDVLVRLDPYQLNNLVEEQNATLTALNTQALYLSEAADRQMVDLKRAQLEETLSVLNEKMTDYVITAPMDGLFFFQTPVNEGQWLSAGQRIGIINQSEQSTGTVRMLIPRAKLDAIAAIKAGEPASIDAGLQNLGCVVEQIGEIGGLRTAVDVRYQNAMLASGLAHELQNSQLVTREPVTVFRLQLNCEKVLREQMPLRLTWWSRDQPLYVRFWNWLTASNR